MEVFLYVLATISLMGFIAITMGGFCAKTAENLMLFQSLPVWFLAGFLLVGLQLLEMQYPGDEGIGYGFGFFVVLPSSLFMMTSLTVPGILGLNMQKTKKDKMLLVSSVIAVASMLTYMVAFIYFPLLSLFILGRKVKQKTIDS